MTWISVKERLPEDGVNVLAWDRLHDPHERIAFVGRPASLGSVPIWYTEDDNFLKVTHWQPLPPPPEVEG